MNLLYLLHNIHNNNYNVTQNNCTSSKKNIIINYSASIIIAWTLYKIAKLLYRLITYPHHYRPIKLYLDIWCSTQRHSATYSAYILAGLIHCNVYLSHLTLEMNITTRFLSTEGRAAVNIPVITHHSTRHQLICSTKKFFLSLWHWPCLSRWLCGLSHY